MSRVARKTVFGPTQTGLMVRCLKFRIWKVEGLCYIELCSENKDADQLICALVFAYTKSRFSHDVAHNVYINTGCTSCTV